jgi:hypothetical protein
MNRQFIRLSIRGVETFHVAKKKGAGRQNKIEKLDHDATASPSLPTGLFVARLAGTGHSAAVLNAI